MVAHLVMLRLHSSLSHHDRDALLDAMRIAFTGIPEVRRVQIGKRLLIGRSYEQQMAEHFDYSAIIEFDSEADLRAYLDHPKHLDLGKRFFQSTAAALVYDFTIVEPDRVKELVLAD